MPSKTPAAITLAFVTGMVVTILMIQLLSTASHAADPAATKTGDLESLKAEITRLKGVVPDQSHAMADVAYHFSNLYFAGQNENWPLAQFYFDETRSHLRWAVRIIPLRKDRDGREVDLGGILTALEQSSLKDLDQAIKSKDKAKFATAYAAQLDNCMACHRAASKEYLQLQIPQRPDASMINFAGEPHR